MRRTLLLALALTPMLASAESPPRGEASDGVQGQALLAEMGAEMFQRYCGSCHGVSGVGDGPVATSLRTQPADLTRIAVRRGGTFPAGDIAAFIDGRFEVDAHGTRQMPIWGRRLAEPIAPGASGEEVARGRIQILVEYLLTIQRAPESD